MINWIKKWLDQLRVDRPYIVPSVPQELKTPKAWNYSVTFKRISQSREFSSILYTNNDSLRNNKTALKSIRFPWHGGKTIAPMPIGYTLFLYAKKPATVETFNFIQCKAKSNILFQTWQNSWVLAEIYQREAAEFLRSSINCLFWLLHFS